jgi:hypothetical protein
MTENKDKNKDKEKQPEEKTEESLPFCTTAPSAEHSRGLEEEEPCDDGREGDYDK